MFTRQSIEATLGHELTNSQWERVSDDIAGRTEGFLDEVFNQTISDIQDGHYPPSEADSKRWYYYMFRFGNSVALSDTSRGTIIVSFEDDYKTPEAFLEGRAYGALSKLIGNDDSPIYETLYLDESWSV